MLRLAISFLFLVSFFGPASAQDAVSNADLVTAEKSDSDHDHFQPYRPKYVFSGTKNIFVKYNPLSLTFGGLLYGYQRFLSPQLSTRCSYEISCSNFGKKAIGQYGLLKGIALAADRLSRCNQLAAYDFSETDIDHENQKIIDDLDLYKVNR